VTLPDRPAYTTELGAAWCADSLEWLPTLGDASVALAMTSPPFALLRQKEYGNRVEDEYLDWLLSFVSALQPKLAEDGSLVIDLGGAYQRGTPTRTLVQWKFLIRAVEDLGYFLAQETYWANPGKLPTPIEWVNKRKIRLKDPVNTVWWLSKTPWPKADTTKVLQPYSDRMKKLLADPSAYYTPKKRPSHHDISAKFTDNGGAIPGHLLTIPNTESNSAYLRACKALDLASHPARFPEGLPEFFIKLLTDPGDLVIDFFAGSNTTGSVAERLGRRWASCELSLAYVAASAFRFLADPSEAADAHQRVVAGESPRLGRLVGLFDRPDTHSNGLDESQRDLGVVDVISAATPVRAGENRLPLREEGLQGA
jgi:DNA modification methylase